jgi:hypothetical protein
MPVTETRTVRCDLGDLYFHKAQREGGGLLEERVGVHPA